MLCRLHVINYALIDDVEIEFGSGLNIITGETGAGKSILIGALGLVLGMRANPEVIRTGEERCVVDVIFDLDSEHPCLGLLQEMGLEAPEGELILRREVKAGGRSRCYANGLAIPVRSLHILGKSLVDLHGQHEHQSLLDVGRHVDFLDGFGELEEMREAGSATYRGLVKLQDRLAEAEADARRLLERRELLEFQDERVADFSRLIVEIWEGDGLVKLMGLLGKIFSGQLQPEFPLPENDLELAQWVEADLGQDQTLRQVRSEMRELAKVSSENY